MYQTLFLNAAELKEPEIYAGNDTLPEWDVSHLAPEYENCVTDVDYADAFRDLTSAAQTKSRELTEKVREMNKAAKRGIVPTREDIMEVLEMQQGIVSRIQRSCRALHLKSQEHFKDPVWQNLSNLVEKHIERIEPALSKPMMEFKFPAAVADQVIRDIPEIAELRPLLAGEAQRARLGDMMRAVVGMGLSRFAARDKRLLDTSELYEKVHNDQQLIADPEKHLQAMADLINAKYFQSAMKAHYATENQQEKLRPDQIASLRDGLPKDFLDQLIPELPKVVDANELMAIGDKIRGNIPRPTSAPEFPREIPWEEARELVTEAFRNFHPDMGEVAELAFDKNWIHAKNNGKKFFNPFTSPPTQSIAVWPGNFPYVLTHYEGTIDDLRTLAHEMGHAVAMYLGSEKHMSMPDSMALHETFAHFAEKMVFSRLFENEPSLQGKAAVKREVFDISVGSINGHGDNGIEHALSMAVQKNLKTPLTIKQIVDIHKDELIKAGAQPEALEKVDPRELIASTALSSQMMQGPDYYMVAYPIAEASSLTLAKLYNGLGPDQRKNMADTWVSIMRAGPEMNYGNAMQTMGVSITTPQKLVSDAGEKIKEDFAAYCRVWPLKGLEIEDITKDAAKTTSASTGADPVKDITTPLEKRQAEADQGEGFIGRLRTERTSPSPMEFGR